MGDTEEAHVVAVMAEADEGTNDPKVPQSQRPGGKKRKVALCVAFVGAGYSVNVIYGPCCLALLPSHSSDSFSHTPVLSP